LPENSKKISLSPLLLSLIVAQVDEAAETTKNISLSFSPTGLDNEEKNCLTSMEQMDFILSLLLCLAVRNSGNLPAKSKDTTPSFSSAASSVKDGKNIVSSMKAKNNSLSSFARVLRASEPMASKDKKKKEQLSSSLNRRRLRHQHRHQRLDRQEWARSKRDKVPNVSSRAERVSQWSYESLKV
jgi:hypothetical protein